jgi:hypothetical protein
LVYRVAGKMSSNNIKCNTTLKAKNSVAVECPTRKEKIHACHSK